VPARDDKKKRDEEMLIVHKPGPKADPGKAGRGPGPGPGEAPRAPALDRQELDLLKKQLGTTKDPAVRRDLIARIQQKFGNDKATEVVREARRKNPKDELLAAKPKDPAGGGSKKGKS
jgi:hypothetical protein